MPKQVPLYDALAADYDRFVNWEGRLAHELPFFEHLFRERGVERVLDSACGTGHHAIALAQQGFQVVGADLSAVMVERARQNAAAAGVAIAFHTAGLGALGTHTCRASCQLARGSNSTQTLPKEADPAEPGTLGEPFDAVLCLGNSLPHLLTSQAIAEALADFAAVLNPSGLLVVQNRNFDLVWAGQERFMPPQVHRDGDQEWLFLRFYDFHEAIIRFNMIRLHRRGQEWEQDVESTELRPIFRDEFAVSLATSGFDRGLFYGSYDGSAFDPAQSGDLIAVATRRD